MGGVAAGDRQTTSRTTWQGDPRPAGSPLHRDGNRRWPPRRPTRGGCASAIRLPEGTQRRGRWPLGRSAHRVPECAGPVPPRPPGTDRARRSGTATPPARRCRGRTRHFRPKPRAARVLAASCRWRRSKTRGGCGTWLPCGDSPRGATASPRRHWYHRGCQGCRLSAQSPCASPTCRPGPPNPALPDRSCAAPWNRR
jgi:hypothetical protein